MSNAEKPSERVEVTFETDPDTAHILDVMASSTGEDKSLIIASALAREALARSESDPLLREEIDRLLQPDERDISLDATTALLLKRYGAITEYTP